MKVRDELAEEHSLGAGMPYARTFGERVPDRPKVEPTFTKPSYSYNHVVRIDFGG